MLEAVVFDLDGILISSEYYKFKAWQEALRTIGIEMSQEEFFEEWTVKGTSFRETMEKYGKPDIKEDDLRPIVNEHYLRSIDNDVCLMPGAMEALDRLKDEFILGLASSSHRLYVDKILEKYEISEVFKGTAAGSEVSRLKPNPDVLLLVTDRMNVKPENCLAIDDAPKGIMAAKNAGMRSIAVPTKITQFGNFEEADIVLPSLDEITVDFLRLFWG